MVKSFVFCLSGIISVFIYSIIIITIIWRITLAEKTPKTYSAYKETTFEVSLLELKKEEKTIKIPQKIVEKKIEKIPEKQEAASKTANVGIGVNDLFRQVESNKPTKQTKPSSKDDVIARKKQAKESSQRKELNNELDKILANLDTKKTLSFSTPKGEYDAFYAKVQEILAENWNPISTTIEHTSLVQITIDSMGNFSYFIQKKSGDIEFDSALQEFLDIMRRQEFPRFQGGSKTTIMVTFKTEV